MSNVATLRSRPLASAPSAAKPKSWLMPVLVAALLVYLPLLVKLGKRLWAADHYSFFPLILLGAGIMACQRIKERSERGCSTNGALLAPGRVWLRNLLAAISLTALAAAVLVHSPHLAGMSALLFLLALMYAFGGGSLVKDLLPVWLFLWLMIPLPLGFDTRLILGLQQIATSWGSSVLDLMGYQHLVEGVVLQLPQRSFEVEEACSGIRSLFAALSCTAFYLILNRRPLIRSLLLLLTVFFWVLVANAIRVVMVVVLYTQWNLPVDKGVGHDMVGFFCFALVMGFVASTDALFMYIVPTGVSVKETLMAAIGRRKRRPASSGVGRMGPLSRPPTATRFDSVGTMVPTYPARPRRRAPFQPFSIEAIAILSVFVVLGLAQVVHAGLGSRSRPTGPVVQLQGHHADLLPKELDGWKRLTYEEVERSKNDINGSKSRIWIYQKGDRLTSASIDGPFHGFHNLGNCLEGQGWTIDSWRDGGYRDLGEQTGGGYSELVVHNGVSRYGHVLFGVFDVENRPFQPPQSGRAGRQFVRRFPAVADLVREWTGQAEEGVAEDDSRSYQVRMFTETYHPFTEEELEDARHLFHALRKIITNSEN